MAEKYGKHSAACLTSTNRLLLNEMLNTIRLKRAGTMIGIGDDYERGKSDIESVPLEKPLDMMLLVS